MFGGGLFWELYQMHRIGTAEAAANRSSSRSTSSADTIAQLERRIDRLTLTCMAMWSLLQETTDLTEEDLAQRVREIDMSDGVQDGKVRPQAIQCSQCGRIISAKHGRCLYCGNEENTLGAFDSSL